MNAPVPAKTRQVERPESHLDRYANVGDLTAEESATPSSFEPKPEPSRAKTQPIELDYEQRGFCDWTDTKYSDTINEDYFINQFEKLLRALTILSLDSEDTGVDNHDKIIKYHNNWLAIKKFELLLEKKGHAQFLESFEAKPSKKDNYISNHYRQIIRHFNSLFKWEDRGIEHTIASPLRGTQISEKVLIKANVVEFVETDDLQQAYAYFCQYAGQLQMIEGAQIRYFFDCCDQTYHQYLWQSIRYLFFCSQVFLAENILEKMKVVLPSTGADSVDLDPRKLQLLKAAHKLEDYKTANNLYRKQAKDVMRIENERLNISKEIYKHKYLKEALTENPRWTKMFIAAENFKNRLIHSDRIVDAEGREFALNAVTTIRDEVYENKDKFTNSGSLLETGINFYEGVEKVAGSVVSKFEDTVNERKLDPKNLQAMLLEGSDSLQSMIDKDKDNASEEIKPFMEAILEITKNQVSFNTKEGAEKYVKNLLAKNKNVQGLPGIDCIMKIINRVTPGFCK